MKKKIRKMALRKETLGSLDSGSLRQAAGALTTVVCSECTTCETVCPPTCEDSCTFPATTCC